ncbi:glycoside hydrolase family 28 protein [Calocera cornea HHB12733]|uniref:galacturonan 1,4-alpha-galacturonidase n=1 Tax=Calocera cornea HHB12733 TaxID=1353952 RepID=A0A165G5C0_9BASI|nr:glycoside hydrolase family 28 protein [Calocera cornea HHB12733]
MCLFTVALLFGALASLTAAQSSNGTCTLIPYGNGRDDSQHFLDTIASPNCTTITLPQPYTYSIQKRLATDLTGKTLNVFGTLLFSDDLNYWINNSWVTDFDTLQAAWIVSGSGWKLSGGGFGQGGIDGNGQAWYTRAKGFGNQPGRPMSLYISNATNGLLTEFSIRQPQFWFIFVDQSKNITLDYIYLNATNHDPDEPPPNPQAGNLGNNWVINTDGFDSYRSDQITVTNWVVQTGDDCIAYKGNSTNIYVRNVTCWGGNGVAYGSLGQYQNRTDNLINITMEDMYFYPSEAGLALTGAAYFKAWVGVHFGDPPNGGGGGTGLVKNVTMRNFQFQDADEPVYLQSCLTYSALPNISAYCNTSTLQFEDVTIEDFVGTSSGKNNGSLVNIACSPAAPCRNFEFVNFNVTAPKNFTPEYTCINAINVTGINCTSGAIAGGSYNG